MLKRWGRIVWEKESKRGNHWTSLGLCLSSDSAIIARRKKTWIFRSQNNSPRLQERDNHLPVGHNPNSVLWPSPHRPPLLNSAHSAVCLQSQVYSIQGRTVIKFRKTGVCEAYTPYQAPFEKLGIHLSGYRTKKSWPARNSWCFPSSTSKIKKGRGQMSFTQLERIINIRWLLLGCAFLERKVWDKYLITKPCKKTEQDEWEKRIRKMWTEGDEGYWKGRAVAPVWE